MKEQIQKIMEQSGVKFGTSGARGLVTAMTDRVCYSYTIGFLNYLQQKGDIRPGTGVAIAGDLRPSTDRIMSAVGKAVSDLGYNVINGGKVPSPAVALYGISNAIPAIMVTGSHIPENRNGIKFNKPGGEILKEDELGIKAREVQINDSLFGADGNFISAATLPPVEPAVEQRYVERYTSFFGPKALKGLNIGLYQHSAVGRDTLASIYTALGASITPLGRSDTFIPVDTEAIRDEDVSLCKQWCSSNDFFSVVSTDGDSDRPLISDETGRWLRGDIAGILCARYLQSDTVCTPVSCNTAVEKTGYFQTVNRTRIGSPFVIAAMNDAVQQGAHMVVGYEANGGFLTNSNYSENGKELHALPTRDAVILHIAILRLAAREKKSVSELLGELPARFTASDRLKEFPQEKSQAIIKKFSSGDEKTDKETISQVFAEICGPVQSIDRTDGVRITFADDNVVHLRPSGNAPEFRCYTESASEESAVSLNSKCMQILKNMT